MKTSTLIVFVASAATLLLLAVPNKGEGSSSDSASSTPFVPKISGLASDEPDAASERLAAQLTRAQTLGWARDPFAPIALPSEPSEVPQPVEPEPIVVPPKEEPAPLEVPEIVKPKPRVGPLPVLTGVSQSGPYRFAIVDRQIVEEGDLLPSGDVVMSIGIRTVTLRKDEEIVVIRLGDGQ